MRHRRKLLLARAAPRLAFTAMTSVAKKPEKGRSVSGSRGQTRATEVIATFVGVLESLEAAGGRSTGRGEGR